MKFIKNYYPDIVIQIGILIALYAFISPPREAMALPSLVYEYTWEKILGLALFSLGLNIAIRRYLNFGNAGN